MAVRTLANGNGHKRAAGDFAALAAKVWHDVDLDSRKICDSSRENTCQMSKREAQLVRVERRNPQKQILSILCPTKFLSTLRMAHRYH
jgi:hypothetical protein